MIPQRLPSLPIETLVNTGAGADVVAVNGTSGGLTLEAGNGTNDITVDRPVTLWIRYKARSTSKAWVRQLNLIIQDRATTSDRTLMHVVTPATIHSRRHRPSALQRLGELSVLGGNAADTFDVAAIVGSTLAQRILIDGGGSETNAGLSKIPAFGGSWPSTDRPAQFLYGG